MLVLSRQKNEAILVGKDIVIRVVRIRKDSVSIGIEAPRGVSVHRQEIFEDILSNPASKRTISGGTVH